MELFATAFHAALCCNSRLANRIDRRELRRAWRLLDRLKTEGRWMSVWRPHSSAFLADNDAPLIGERAQRGRIATEGGDAHGGANRARVCVPTSRSGSLAVNRPAEARTPNPIARRRHARSGRRGQGRARSSAVGGPALPIDAARRGRKTDGEWQ
jgi:hypothetical protein